MKYIATSSLNIDNILSTESISPFSFYIKRTFGYNNFDQIKELSDFDGILLFSKIPSFTINDNERESFPMVIAVNDDEQLEDIKKIGEFKSCEIFFYSKTIHLTPNNSRILFFTDKAKILSYHNCLDSKLCKMIEYFQIETTEPSDYPLSNIIKSISKNYHYKIQYNPIDNSYDKVKGFIYGYYLGAMRSLSENTANLKRISNRIYDIISTIENSNGQNYSTFQEELNKLDDEYSNFDPGKNRTRELWENEIGEFVSNDDKFINFLRDIDMEAEIKKAFCKKHNIQMRPKLPDFKYACELGKYRDLLITYTKNIINKERNNNNVSICNELDVDSDKYASAMMAIDNTINTEYNKIINSVLWSELIPNIDKLSTHRFEVATDIIKEIRTIWKNSRKDWDNSKERHYFHYLRQNINDFTPFNPKECDNIVLQSLAAFILKGEDLEALINYLEHYSIHNYRYTLALWGGTLGYIKIPKTAMSNLKIESFEEVYKNSYNLLNGKKYKGELVRSTKKIETHSCYIQTSQASNSSFSNTSHIPSQGIDKLMPSNSDNNWKNKILDIWNDLNIKTSKKKLYDRILSMLQKEKMTPKEFFDILKKDKDFITEKGNPKKVVKDLEEKYNQNNTCGIKANITDQRTDTLPFQFTTDQKYSTEIKTYYPRNNNYEYNYPSFIKNNNLKYFFNDIEDCALKEKLISNLETFQNEYNSGYYSKHPDKYPKINSKVISHFIKYCFHESAKAKLENTSYLIDLLNKYKTKLLKEFPDK